MQLNKCHRPGGVVNKQHKHKTHQSVPDAANLKIICATKEQEKMLHATVGKAGNITVKGAGVTPQTAYE